MMKVLWINAADQTVSTTSARGIDDLQELVGGYLEPALTLSINAETGIMTRLYVDEDGRVREDRSPFAFQVHGTPEIYVGSGVIMSHAMDTGEPCDVDLPAIRSIQVDWLISVELIENQPAWVGVDYGKVH